MPFVTISVPTCYICKSTKIQFSSQKKTKYEGRSTLIQMDFLLSWFNCFLSPSLSTYMQDIDGEFLNVIIILQTKLTIISECSAALQSELGCTLSTSVCYSFFRDNRLGLRFFPVKPLEPARTTWCPQWTQWGDVFFNIQFWCHLPTHPICYHSSNFSNKVIKTLFEVIFILSNFPFESLVLLYNILTAQQEWKLFITK